MKKLTLNENIIYNIYNNKPNINDINTLFIQDAITGTRYILKNVYKPRNQMDMTSQSIYDRRERRIQNVIKCIQNGYVQTRLMKEKEAYKLLRSKQGCNNRLCANCNLTFQKANRYKLRNIVKHFKESRFMTINFRNVETITKEYVSQCAKYFNLMRKYLKRDGYTLGNYINVMEIKHSKERGWNLHYHIIFEGGFIPVRVGRKALKRATKGDSFYVHIQYIGKERIRNKARAVNYITKYISKMNFQSEDLAIMLQYYKATNRMRFIKVVVDKHIKSLLEQKGSEFEDFYLYLRESTEKESIEILAYLLELQLWMDRYEMKYLDYSLSLEENVFIYGSDNKQLEVCGV